MQEDQEDQEEPQASTVVALVMLGVTSLICIGLFIAAQWVWINW